MVAVWEPTSGAQPPSPAQKPKAPIGLRSRSPAGVVETLGKALKALDEHAEEVLLVVFFLAFVWFALDWLIIIMR